MNLSHILQHPQARDSSSDPNHDASSRSFHERLPSCDHDRSPFSSSFHLSQLRYRRLASDTSERHAINRSLDTKQPRHNYNTSQPDHSSSPHEVQQPSFYLHREELREPPIPYNDLGWGSNLDYDDHPSSFEEDSWQDNDYVDEVDIDNLSERQLRPESYSLVRNHTQSDQDPASDSDGSAHPSTRTSLSLAPDSRPTMPPIDLTGSASSPSLSSKPKTRKKRARSPTDAAGPSRPKRRRTSVSVVIPKNDETEVKAESQESQPEVIDLADVDDESSLQETLKKQRAEQVQAQTEDLDVKKGKGTKLTMMNCTVCLDSPTDLTATICGMSITTSRSLTHTDSVAGHAFCRGCLMSWLASSSKRNHPRHPNCPACRTAINQRTKLGGVVNLEIMMKRKTKKPPDR
ncbi:MAG: SUMO-targeted ubiquitin ligase complex subunit slx8 [Chrysothrix sp. TS-e1954]|nr:MAG: SUMO-targeted ubiquitin ligase complex subunit slx8 [Chrysothrix sp. TS-e1954]